MILAWFALSYGALLLAPALFAAYLQRCRSRSRPPRSAFAFSTMPITDAFRTASSKSLIARLCSVLLGPSRHFWVHKHQGMHHRQPNVFGWDDDLETRGLLRLSPACAWKARFRRQELKAVVYYGLNTLEWLFWKDLFCLAHGRLNKCHAVDLSGKDRTELLVCKGLYLF